MKTPNNLKLAAEKMALAPEELEAMRSHLKIAMETGPVRNGSANRRIRQEMFNWLTNLIHERNFMPVIIAIILLSLGAGGTSYAAQSSLPGDVLYPVKIHVNDEVRSLLAISPEAKAKIEAILAGERLKEAEALASTSKLDDAMLKTINENFNDHIKSAREEADKLKSKNDPSAQSVEKEISLMLKEHDQELSKISGESESDDDSAVESLQKEIQDHQDEFNEEDNDDLNDDAKLNDDKNSDQEVKKDENESENSTDLKGDLEVKKEDAESSEKANEIED